MRRCVYVFSHHKMDIEIPAPLKNLPNVTFIEEPTGCLATQSLQAGLGSKWWQFPFGESVWSQTGLRNAIVPDWGMARAAANLIRHRAAQ